MNPDTPELCVVQTALPSEAQATELARAIVQQRLGACVQVQAIRSFTSGRNGRMTSPSGC